MNWESLFSRRTLGMRLGLDFVGGVHRALGRPAARVPAIHIVGTNGKGSAAAMAAHALTGGAGLRVGLYTSPHLHRVNERIVVGGCPISDESLAAYVDHVLAVEAGTDLARPLSFFEILTLCALLAFDEGGVEVAVLEAGLGGRYDATRLGHAKVTVVTSIGLDHQRYLGDTLVEIAREKAAVLKPNTVALTAPQRPRVHDVLAEEAARVGTSIRVVDPLPRAPRGLEGDHQRVNGALALASARTFAPGLGLDALDGVEWPGRLERTACGAGAVVLDVAHNPDGIEALCRHMVRLGASNSKSDALVFGCMDDKDGETMVRRLGDLGIPLLLVPPPASGAAEPTRLASDNAGVQTFRSVEDPRFRRAWDLWLARGATLWVCGSHVLVGALRARALGHAAERPHPGDPR